MISYPFYINNIHMKIDLYLTEKCNLGCKYCYLHEKNLQDMSESTLINAIDHFLSKGAEEKYYITFIGGEPMIKFNLIEKAVNHCKSKFSEKEIFYNIVTNGTLFDHRKLKLLKQHKFYMVLSLDGTQRSHDTNRVKNDGTGSFELIEPYFSQIQESITNLFVRMTVTPETVQYLHESLNFLYSKGFKGIGFVPALECNWGEEDIKVFQESIIKFLPQWEEALEKQDLIILPLINYLVHRDNPNYIFHYYMHPCQLGSQRYSVSINGDIYPCHRFVSFDRTNKDYILGNVNNSNKHSEFILPKLPKSKDELNALGCMAVNYDVNKNPTLPLKNYKLFYDAYKKIIDFTYSDNPTLIKRLKEKKYDSFQWESQFLTK